MSDLFHLIIHLFVFTSLNIASSDDATQLLTLPLLEAFYFPSFSAHLISEDFPSNYIDKGKAQSQFVT